MPSEKQNAVKITKDDVKRELKPMPDWKGARPDKIQGFWLKSFTAVHEALATVLNECVEVGGVPGWLIEGGTILVMKDSKKGNEVGNYKPIAKQTITRRIKRKQKKVPRDKRSTCDRQMHIAKLQKKKGKFKHGLGGLQKGRRYCPPLMDYNDNGNGTFS